jgi:hypothetical protein
VKSFVNGFIYSIDFGFVWLLKNYQPVSCC